MRKKWLVSLSIITLLLSFLPNLLEGYKAFADGQTVHKENINLVNHDNLKISYDMVETSDDYIWNIHYQINFSTQPIIKNKVDDNIIPQYKADIKGILS